MLPGGIYLLGENFIIFLCCLLSSEMGERKNRAGKNKCDACGKHRIGARLEMKGHGSQKPWQKGGFSTLGWVLGAGTAPDRDGWTPHLAPMPQFPSMSCHTQGTFGAHQGGSTTSGWPLMGPISPQPCHSVRMVGRRGYNPHPILTSSLQCCAHPEVGVSGPLRTPGWRDSTQPSPTTPQLTLRGSW